MEQSLLNHLNHLNGSILVSQEVDEWWYWRLIETRQWLRRYINYQSVIKYQLSNITLVTSWKTYLAFKSWLDVFFHSFLC